MDVDRPLDYKSPDSVTPINWRRAYVFGATLVGLGHLVGSILFLFFAFLIGGSDGVKPVPPLFLNLFYVYESPAIFVHIKPGLTPFLLAAGSNAAIWGVCIIGAWHLYSIVINRLGGWRKD
jgi:hypothetical protein